MEEMTGQRPTSSYTQFVESEQDTLRLHLGGGGGGRERERETGREGGREGKRKGGREGGRAVCTCDKLQI